MAPEKTMSGEVVKNAVIPEADNNSFKAKSMYHSLGSSYWQFKPAQQNAEPMSNDRLDILSRLSHDRQSMLSTPLVEFDSLGQKAPQQNSECATLGINKRLRRKPSNDSFFKSA